MSHRLVLLRHAKSDYPVGVPDHDRPLNARGRRDAPAAGRWLDDNVGRIDLALVSTARRAQQTWHLAHGVVTDIGEVRDEGAIYEASESRLLDIVRGLPESAGTALLVGHNPGLELLAHSLAGPGDSIAARAMAVKYPTCGIAVILAGGQWRDVAHDARLVDFAVPRG